MTSASVITLPHQPAVGTAAGHEGLPCAVRDAGQVELEGEPLLVPVRPPHVHRLDAVQRLLGQPDDLAVLGGDLRGDLACAGPEPGRRHDIQHRAVTLQFQGGNGVACVHHRPQELLWHEAGQVRCSPQCAAVHFWQPEIGVVGGKHDVGAAREADATAEAEALHGSNNREGALVDSRERREAAAVGPDQGRIALGRLHFLDVDARAEAASLSGEDHGPHAGVLARLRDHVRQVEPALYGQRVHGREVDHDLGDAAASPQIDRHAGTSLAP